ncbi:MAG: c-type cytochrome [Acidobacteria bacterium]|nr:c-type cytochrome [Acidobacteriota bacterium]
MKLTWQRALFGLLVTSVLLGALNLHKAQAQTTGGVAAAQKPLYARLAWKRTSPSDLELGGDLSGTPPNTARYITREQLLALPQVSFTVTNDPNFSGATQVSGVPLEQLIQALAANPQSDLAVAICRDKYEAHYPNAYVAAHQPVLALKINGNDPAGWPKFPEGGADLGPYLISSADFKPSFKTLSHEDAPQIPWGVVRLEFQSEAVVFDAIRPRGANANSQEVQDGYRIAQQNCFRCHNSGDQGGHKAQRPWTLLTMWATASPDYFTGYIHNPKSKNPKSQMEGFPNYDSATLNALTKYFQSLNVDMKTGKP